MATKGLVRLFEPVLGWMADRYRASVGASLRKYGLRYEDLYDPLLNQDVEEALKRLPQDVVDARTQRLKRAHDCSLKKSYLSKEMQEKQTPFEPYLAEALARVEAENAERALLNTGKTYDRSIP